MSIDSTDLSDAARTVADAITGALAGPDVNSTHYATSQSQSVAGGLFAVAAAIEKLAEAVEMNGSSS